MTGSWVTGPRQHPALPRQLCLVPFGACVLSTCSGPAVLGAPRGYVAAAFPELTGSREKAGTFAERENEDMRFDDWSMDTLGTKDHAFVPYLPRPSLQSPLLPGRARTRARARGAAASDAKLKGGRGAKNSVTKIRNILMP